MKDLRQSRRSFNAFHLPRAFREAIDTHAPDRVFIGDGWYLKFPLAAALAWSRCGRRPLQRRAPHPRVLSRDGQAAPDDPAALHQPRHNDALGTHRMIGMIQPNPNAGDETKLHRTGCAGRITEYRETDDGRIAMVLSGVCRYDVDEVLSTTRGYSLCVPNWSRFRGDYATEEVKLHGAAMRVPVADGSVCDLTFVAARESSVEELQQAFVQAAAGSLKGILRAADEALVSTDIIGETHSTVVDLPLISQVAADFFRVVGWYDNENAYALRCVDLAEYMVDRENA